MELFNDGWQFCKQQPGTTYEEVRMKGNEFRSVEIPHDWAIYHENFYEDAVGWYRREFVWNSSSEELAVLRFEGIYMDSRLYINGKTAYEWKNGYTTFEADITRYLFTGVNEIYVCVNYLCPNSRWYSGAGIYRDVWLKVLPREHIISDSIYISTQKKYMDSWEIKAEVMTTSCLGRIIYEIADKNSGRFRQLSGLDENEFLPDGVVRRRLQACINNVRIWNVEEPFCYQIRVSLEIGGKVVHSEIKTIGFRTFELSPEQGFYLNGKKLKLKGVCEHHDLGCLGAAYHSDAMRRKFKILKEMGVNAVRLSHNVFSEDVMELADEMGILIISEGFDMWEMPKTKYDYARFFPDWYKKDIKSWICRDRNHPSLLMWGIGNEIYDTHAGENGLEWTRKLVAEVMKYDSRKNAYITLASNYMPWENAQKCAELVDVVGYNYGEKYYLKHHREHPDWIIYGSETCATVQSRGIYHFPYRQPLLADADEQCSALGNSRTSWGAKSAEACLITEREHPFSCGQFIWSGFDYIGEPTPYHTRNSYFGQIDTAGFRKDSYYIFKAGWTDYKKDPMVHIFPYWDFNEGQPVDVLICSNAPKVELFLNNKSQGCLPVDHRNGETLLSHWQIPYEKGCITARAYDEDENIIAEESKHSFGNADEIIIHKDREVLPADGKSLCFVEISVRDRDGYIVENANNRINIELTGPIELLGTDNGDSTEKEGYKTNSKKMFSGKLLAVIRAGRVSGKARIMAVSQGLKAAGAEIEISPGEIKKGLSAPVPVNTMIIELRNQEIPVRNIFLNSEHGLMLHPGNIYTEVKTQIVPEDANDKELIFSIADDAGIPSKLAVITEMGNKVRLEGKSDGQFWLRCMSKAGTDHIRIISQQRFTVSGLGRAYKDPYNFISAGLYDFSAGEIGNGNEHGVATARDGESMVGFAELDFGEDGSDEITMPIFALTDEPYRIRIYETELIGDVIYQKPSIWNVYQEETFKLKKQLKGITSIYFMTDKKIHLKGFTFIRQNRALAQNFAASCDAVYGDQYNKTEKEILNIGNNVTITFKNMNFGKAGIRRITIAGKTILNKNTITILFTGSKEQRQIVEFKQGEGEQTFPLELVTGIVDVEFVFFPGCDFDFRWFQFSY